MTDKLLTKDQSLLSKKLIGKISNMKQFWNSVSDDDLLIEKMKRVKCKTMDPFSGMDHLTENLKSKKAKYANLVAAYNNVPESENSQKNILEDVAIKRKMKCEKGNTKEQLSFWEGILTERSNEDESVGAKPVLGNY